MFAEGRKTICLDTLFTGKNYRKQHYHICSASKINNLLFWLVVDNTEIKSKNKYLNKIFFVAIYKYSISSEWSLQMTTVTYDKYVTFGRYKGAFKKGFL